MKKKDTSWSGVAKWYDKHLSEGDSYHEKVILPNLLRLMALVPKDRVLDLACGTGFFTREFFKQTKNIVGADISKELIDIARKNSAAPTGIGGATGGIKYIVSPADKLGAIADSSIDKIALVLAIQNIAEVKEMIKECSRVLAPKGNMHIVMNHPAFRAPKATFWGWDEVALRQFRRVDAYLSESKIPIEMHPGKKEKNHAVSQTLSFHRPIQYYFKLFAGTGFAVTRLEEWISHKKSSTGPRQKEEDRMRKEIPLFMYMEVRKSF